MIFKNKRFFSVIITLSLLLILATPVSAESLSFDYFIQKFENAAQRYDRGEISIAQLIVLLENYKQENNEYLERNNIPGWRDISSLDKYEYQFGHKIETHDIQIFLGTYEVKDGYYNFGYSVGGRKFSESYLKNEWPDKIESFKKDLKEEFRKENPNFKELAKQLFEIEKPMDRYDRCMSCAKSMEKIQKEQLPDYLQGRYYLIQPAKGERKFKETILKESYDDCMDNCWKKEQCKKICESYKSEIVFIANCSKEEKRNYFSVDHQGQSEEFSSFVNTLSSHLNSEFQKDRCENYGYESSLYFRKKLQNSLNNHFFEWYVGFLDNKMKKDQNTTVIGFERIMNFLIRNEKMVSEVLKCKGENSWPEEFQKIKIDYQKGNKEFHIWEELVPTGGDFQTWSTLYKYKVIPDKELMKDTIQYQLSQKSTFGPPEVEKEKMKQKDEVMKIIEKLVSGFGNSLDFAVILEDNGEQFLKRYVRINKDIIFEASDNPGENLDFTVTLKLNSFYDFANQMNSIDSQKVRGPSWVDTESRTPMMIGERISLIFKLWNSLSFDSWWTRFRLITKIGRIMNYLREIKKPSAQEEAVIQNIEEQLKTEF